MPSNYAGVNSFHPQITIPSDGDPAVSESVNTSLRSIQDDAVYFNTNLGFKIDSRGGIYNQTGSINIVPAGPVQVQFNILVNQIQLGNGAASTVTVSAGNANVIGSNLNVTSDNTYLTSPITSIGSGSTQQLNVNSATDVFGFVTLHNDLESGHDISTNTLNVDGGADFNCNAQITHTGQVLTVGGQAVVNNGLVVTGGVTKTRTTQLGQSSTDFHQINGDVTAANDVEIQGTLTVEGAITSNASSGNSFGDTTIGGALSVLGNTTIGNSASDTVTFNAQLSGALQMGPNGRVTPSPALFSSSQNLNIGSPRIISILGGSTPITLTIDDTGMVPGDGFEIFYSQGSASLTISVSNGNSTGAITQSSIIRCVRFNGAAATNWGFVGSARTL